MVALTRARLGVEALPLVALLILALAVRLPLVAVPGHYGDVTVMARWAESLATYGPFAFYTRDGSVYPALLPFVWPLGLLLDGDPLRVAVKSLSIPFDLLLGTLLAAVVARHASPRTGLLAGGLYLFNPGVLIAGPMWGQVDAYGTLLALAAILALAAGRFGWAGALAVLAGMAKPQFGLIGLPVIVLALIAWRRGAGPRPLATAALGGLGAYALLSVAFGMTPQRYLSLLVDVAALKPMVSLNAPNPWGMLIGYRVDDGPYALIGLVLLVAGLLAALLPLRRRQDLGTLLAVGLLITFAFYFLPTRVHERYLFPALALAIPFAAVDRRGLVAYVALSLVFAISMLYAMIDTTQLSLPADIETVLASRWTVWVIGLTLIGQAVALGRLALRGRLSPERRIGPSVR